MESKKINQLATELAPVLSDLTIIGDPTTGISRKITLSQMASLFTGTVEEYPNLASFPLVGTADTIYIALDTNIIYRWNTGTNAYVELSPNIVTSLVFNDANGFDGTINLVGSTATLTITTALTQGSVPFIGTSGALTQDNANLFFDDTNNRLGINTNAPTTALDVFGSGIIGRLNGTSTNNAFLGFANAGTNRWSIGNVQSDHRFRIYSETNTSELITVLQTGEFGIGIANPTTKVHIDGGATALIANLDANVSVAKSISFRSDNSNRINLEVSGTESGSNAGANFFLRTYTDAGALIETPFSIVRSTGITTIKSLTLTNALSVANGGTGSTTQNFVDLTTTQTIGGAKTFTSQLTGANAKILTEINLDRATLTSATPLRFSTNGTNNWFIGPSPLGASTNDLSFYSYATTSTVLTIANSTGNIGIGASTNPQNLLEVSTAGGSPRIRVGTLQNNNNTARFEAITSSTISTANSAWLRVTPGGGFILGQSSYTKTGGDSGNFANLSSESETPVITVTSGNNIGIGTSNPNRKLVIMGGNGNQLELDNTGQTYTQAFWKLNGVETGTIWASTSEFHMYTYGAQNILFSNNNTERIRINTAGYTKISNTGVHISNTSNTHELTQTQSNWLFETRNNASSPYGFIIRYQIATPNNNTNEYLYFDDATAVRVKMLSNGGLANYQANNTNLSDERTKKEILPLESYWNKFKAIEIVKFKYKDQTHDDFNIGVIAQQLESIAPEFIDADGWDNKPKFDEEGNQIISEEIPLKSVYTSDLHHATIKVLQEAMAKIEILEEKIKQLESK
jgi:hypothetical protein